jgi:hypothetical protein
LLSEFKRTKNKKNNASSEEHISTVTSSTINNRSNMNGEQLSYLENKIDEITRGLDKAWSKNLLEGLPSENVGLICNYIISMRTEINPADNYRRDSIKMPYLLSRYLKNKPFSEMTRQDIIRFLDSSHWFFVVIAKKLHVIWV